MTESVAQGELPRSSYLGAAAGLSGAAVAWLVSQLITDVGGLVPSYRWLDLVVLALLGGAIGGSVLGAAARRRELSIAVEGLAGATVGALAAAVGGLIGSFLVQLPGLGGTQAGFLVARVATWALAGGLTGAALGTRSASLDQGRPIDGLVFGVVGGAVAALIYSLPGPTGLWQGVGFLLVGFSIGFGTNRLDRAIGVVRRASEVSRRHRLSEQREWEIYRDRSLPIGGDFDIVVAADRLTLHPRSGRPVFVTGQAVSQATALRDTDVVVVADRQYRFHRFGPGQSR